MTAYYAVLDSNDTPVAFYNMALYPPNADGSINGAIPSTAIGITAAQYSTAINGSVQWNGSAFIAYTAPVVITADTVTTESTLRLYGGFTYNNVAYQTDPASISNILGAAQLAYMKVAAGAQAGDYSWMSGNANQPFTWIALDNSQVQMDAPTVVAFAEAAAAFRQTIIFCARALKDALAAGQTIDLYNDSSWGGYSVPTVTPTS